MYVSIETWNSIKQRRDVYKEIVKISEMVKYCYKYWFSLNHCDNSLKFGISFKRLLKISKRIKK